MNGLIPIPFTIAAALIIIICVFSKFSHHNTFFTGAAYALIGLLEPAVHAYFIYLLWSSVGYMNIIVMLSIIALGYLYLINLVSIILMNIIFCKDIKFKSWYKASRSSLSYIVFSTLSIFFSFKVINIIFSNLFNVNIFKAKLQHPSRLFYLHLMSFLSLVHSFWAIAMAAYNLYYTTNIATMLFFESVDLIIVVTIQIILGLFNARKDDDFFDEN